MEAVTLGILFSFSLHLSEELAVTETWAEWPGADAGARWGAVGHGQ